MRGQSPWVETIVLDIETTFMYSSLLIMIVECFFYGQRPVSQQNLGANTVVFWAIEVVFWANTVIFWVNKVLFGANTLT